jgi:hypothetical protein
VDQEQEHDRDGSGLDEAVAVMLVVVVLAVLAIVPFTVLSPFRYPQPSTWQSFPSINLRITVNSVPLLQPA